MKQNSKIKYTLFLLGMLLITIPNFTPLLSANYGIDSSKTDELEKITFNPAYTNDDDKKYIFLYDADYNQIYVTAFRKVSSFTILNTQVPWNLEHLDYIIIVNTDSSNDGDADDWKLKSVKIYDKYRGIVIPTGPGQVYQHNPTLSYNNNVEFGEYWDQKDGDTAILTLKVTSTSMKSDSNKNNLLFNSDGFISLYKYDDVEAFKKSIQQTLFNIKAQIYKEQIPSDIPTIRRGLCVVTDFYDFKLEQLDTSINSIGEIRTLLDTSKAQWEQMSQRKESTVWDIIRMRLPQKLTQNAFEHPTFYREWVINTLQQQLGKLLTNCNLIYIIPSAPVNRYSFDIILDGLSIDGGFKNFILNLASSRTIPEFINYKWGYALDQIYLGNYDETLQEFSLMSGKFGVSSTNIMFSAFEKIKLGWVNPQIITKSTNDIELRPAEQYLEVVKISVSPTEYFLVEYRQKPDLSNSFEFDGLVVYYINESVLPSDSGRIFIRPDVHIQTVSARDYPEAVEPIDVWYPDNPESPGMLDVYFMHNAYISGFRMENLTWSEEGILFDIKITLNEDYEPPLTPENPNPNPEAEKIAVFLWDSSVDQREHMETYESMLRTRGYSVFIYMEDCPDFDAFFSEIDEREGPEDTIFIYMHGHGSYTWNEDNHQYDSRVGVSNHPLYSSNLRTYFDQFEAENKAFFTAACHSGGFVEDFKGSDVFAMSSSCISEMSTANRLHPKGENVIFGHFVRVLERKRFDGSFRKSGVTAFNWAKQFGQGWGIGLCFYPSGIFCYPMMPSYPQMYCGNDYYQNNF
ncbi:MAG: hypothetical protein JXA99_16920 [Candidatus Lokiarchaeota archaeon]|nr:hypothetical protein [Candidatus Lokiarchaeota archaeon]